MIAGSFFTDFAENITGQYDECRGYKLLCESQKFNPYNDLKEESDIEKVPFVATTLFKKSNKLYSQLLRVNPDTLEKWTVSSSTSGDPSIVGRNASDIAEIREIVKLDRNVFKPKYGFDCVFFPEPKVMRFHGSEKLLGKPTESYIGNLLNIFDFSDETIFLLKEDGDGFRIDVEGFIKFIKTHDGKNDNLSIRGSTLLLFNTVQGLKGKISPVSLGSKAFIHTGGGGWDGHKGSISAGKKIERRQFVEEVSDFLGISRKNFIDTYSFTENSTPLTGHYCEDFHDYLFHVPKWGKVIIRDTKTFEPLHKSGDRGFIEVLNAHGTSAFAGASVLVDDMAEIVSTEKCPGCGAGCMTIRIIGRVKGAEAKGCGATLKVGGNGQ
jgi:hypothetical protein